MSNTIKLFDSLPGIGIFNKTVVFRSPMQLPDEKVVKLRVSRVQVSDRIPNVFDARPYGIQFDNTRVRVATGVDPYQDIQLEPGLYLTGATLGAAINAAIASLGWWMNPADPGLIITENPVIDRFVITIIDTKLALGHGGPFHLDLRAATNNGSNLWHTLGFLSTTELIGSGTYNSPNVPVMETQGTTCVVCCSVMPVRLVNENYQPYVADVDFAGKFSTSDNIWPTGNVGNDMIIYSGPRTISQATFYVLTDEGIPMVFMNGRLKIEILFYW